MIPPSPFESIVYLNPSQVTVRGALSERYWGNRQYLKRIYETRHEWMLEPFQNRGQEWVIKPVRDKKGELAWAGEYAGKWLDAASLTASGGQDEQLSRYTDDFAAALIANQEPDGYLGIELPARRGIGWDVWNVWIAMSGLLTHYENCKSVFALQAAINCGNWLIHCFGTISNTNNPFFSRAHDDVCNSPVIQEFVRLYRLTQDRRFIDFASSVVENYPHIDTLRQGEVPLIHAYHLTEFLAGVVDLAVVEKRTEELQWIESTWQNLVARHLYPTGSLSFREQLMETAPNDIPVANGRPDKHHQETCATVGWMLLCASLYQATGRVRYIESLEKTLYNALLAAQSTGGQKWMYYTPLRYEKRWFSGPTSCCYWSGPRGVARLPGLVYALDDQGLLVNLYESSSARFIINGHRLTLEQSSAYPDRGQAIFQVGTDAPVGFALRIRTPYFSQKIRITLNSQDIVARSENEGYFTIRREWCTGDEVQIRFEIPVTLNRFMNDQYGVVARGAEVLSIDQRDNPSIDLDSLEIPNDVALCGAQPVAGRRRYIGGVVADGKLTQAIFTPYADAGGDGALFRTAFPIN